MIRGVTKNIALVPPGAYKDLDEAENFIPASIDLRNGFMTDAGNWNKRPGYTQSHDIGFDVPIDLLIPEGGYGFAVTENGRVFQLASSSAVELTGTVLNGSHRPTWTNQDGVVAICDGGNPVKITILGASATVGTLGGSPSNFRFIDQVGPYAIGCGHDDTEFKWSASNNIENWTTGDSGFANVKKGGDGDIIRNMGVIKDRVSFFKGKNIELWYNRGGSTPFVRIDTIEKGIGADDSLIKEFDAFYFLGDDLRFYSLAGNQLTPISSPFENYIQSLVDPSSIYGFNFLKEHLIKWVAPTDGKVMVFDYKNKIWSEDNHWEHGQWERIPMNSYMEINNKQYFGSFNLDGLIHEWSKDYQDDNGTPIRVYRKLAVKPSESGRNAKFTRLGFRLKRGVATSGETAPKMFWRYRLDRGPWKAGEDIDMGVLGDTDPYVERHGLGVGREIEIETVETDAVDFLHTHMDLTAVELGR